MLCLFASFHTLCYTRCTLCALAFSPTVAAAPWPPTPTLTQHPPPRQASVPPPHLASSASPFLPRLSPETMRFAVAIAVLATVSSFTGVEAGHKKKVQAPRTLCPGSEIACPILGSTYAALLFIGGRRG